MQLTETEKLAVIDVLDGHWKDALKAKAALREHYKHNDPLGAEAIRLKAESDKAVGEYAALEAFCGMLGWMPRKHEWDVVELMPFDVRAYHVHATDNRGFRRVIHTFATGVSCREWIMRGLNACEGAEREHYASLLSQLESGEHELSYD